MHLVLNLFKVSIAINNIIHSLRAQLSNQAHILSAHAETVLTL